MRAPISRSQLSVEGLLKEARRWVAMIPDDPHCGIALVDHLMAGLVLFGLKHPSLLQFDQDCREGTTPANLRALYSIKRASSDPRFRERLDRLDPRPLRPHHRRLFALLQRGKGLEGFAWLDRHYLLSLDGTGYFSSQKVHCAQWGEKHHRHGTVMYYNIALQQLLHVAAGISGLRKVPRASAY